MPATKDPYKILGVDKQASPEDIKKAYRKLARQYHPDRNPGDSAAEERFKEVQSAYDVVGDADKRKQYDAFGSANGRPGGWGGAGDFDLGDLGGMFGDLFSGGSRFRRGRREDAGRRGADLRGGERQRQRCAHKGSGRGCGQLGPSQRKPPVGGGWREHAASPSVTGRVTVVKEGDGAVDPDPASGGRFGVASLSDRYGLRHLRVLSWS